MYEARQHKDKVSHQINAVKGITKQKMINHSKNIDGIRLNYGCTNNSILQFFMSVDEFKKSTPVSQKQHRRKLAKIDAAIIDLDNDAMMNIGLVNFNYRLLLLESLKNEFDSYKGKRNLRAYKDLLYNEIKVSKGLKSFLNTYQLILNPQNLQGRLDRVGQIKKYLAILRDYEKVNGRSVSSLKNDLYITLTFLSKKIFSRYIKHKQYENAIRFLDATYFDKGLKDKLIVDPKMEESTTHASTTGRLHKTNHRDSRQIKFNKNYLIAMNKDGLQGFYKVINTLKHERIHYEQRLDRNYKKNTTKEEREFMAYSEELIKTEGIPQLVGNYYISTYLKMKKQYEVILANVNISEEMKLKYKQRFECIPGG